MSRKQNVLNYAIENGFISGATIDWALDSSTSVEELVEHVKSVRAKTRLVTALSTAPAQRKSHPLMGKQSSPWMRGAEELGGARNMSPRELIAAVVKHGGVSPSQFIKRSKEVSAAAKGERMGRTESNQMFATLSAGLSPKHAEQVRKKLAAVGIHVTPAHSGTVRTQDDDDADDTLDEEEDDLNELDEADDDDDDPGEPYRPRPSKAHTPQLEASNTGLPKRGGPNADGPSMPYGHSKTLSPANRKTAFLILGDLLEPGNANTIGEAGAVNLFADNYAASVARQRKREKEWEAAESGGDYGQADDEGEE